MDEIYFSKKCPQRKNHKHHYKTNNVREGANIVTTTPFLLLYVTGSGMIYSSVDETVKDIIFFLMFIIRKTQ